MTISRKTEMGWLAEQTTLYKELAGQWVAVEGRKLIAHADTLAVVLEMSRAKGIEHPFVVCLPLYYDHDIAIIAMERDVNGR